MSPSPAETVSSNPDQPVPWYARLFASGLLSGYSPVASGTAGSAVGLAFYLIPGFEHPLIIIPLLFLTFVLGTKAAGLMELRYGHDPAEVTIDEVLGMWVSLVFVPKSLAAAIVAFFLFRIMDIVKPWPARRFDAIRGGFGIMMDDVVAGFYANVVTHALVRFGLLSFLPF